MKWVFGVLTGSTLAVLVTNSFDAYAAGFVISGSPTGTLMVLGLGMVGLGLWGRRKIREPRRKKRRT